jgi:amidase
MAVVRPTLDQLRETAERLYLTLSDDDLRSFRALMEPTLVGFDTLESLDDALPEVRYPRTPGVRPAVEENPYNAWYVKTSVRGAAGGPLRGKRVVLKDNVCLAGVPMMNGASTLEGYVPEVDATVATRILDAGGEIVGKAHCEYFCLSGGSHTNATGPVQNPRKPGYSAGGSSSGSAALVAAREVDMAIGGDQGGSIRIPASYCGIVGMKPTHGLVPYTGIMPIEVTIDHAGPMTEGVADNALLLEVIAGADGLDPRQIEVRTDSYTAALGQSIDAMRIGVVTEGFGHEISMPEVDSCVEGTATCFEKLGAAVERVSVPMHQLGGVIWSGLALEGLNELMMKGNGFGTNWKGLYLPSLIKAHAAWRGQADKLSETLKLSMLVGEWIHDQYRGTLYGRAQNQSLRLRAAYDEALASCDALLMPTLPMTASRIPEAGAPREEVVARGFEMIPNTAPFDATGHPAISIPCGQIDGLPVGLMLVGKRFDEKTLYRLAHAFEEAEDWKTR